MYLSYSGYKTYQTCPRKYWCQYVGKVETPEPPDALPALYGSIIGLVFEQFYKQKIWKLQDKAVETLQGMVADLVEKEIAHRTKKGDAYKWTAEKAMYTSKYGVIADVKQDIVKGIATIKEHRLIGTYAEAELDLTCMYGAHKIGLEGFAAYQPQTNSECCAMLQ